MSSQGESTSSEASLSLAPSGTPSVSAGTRKGAGKSSVTPGAHSVVGSARGHPSVRGEERWVAGLSPQGLLVSPRVSQRVSGHSDTGDMSPFLSASQLRDRSGPGGFKNSRVDADSLSPLSSSISFALSSQADDPLSDISERKQGSLVAEIQLRRNSVERLSEIQTLRHNKEKEKSQAKMSCKGGKAPKIKRNADQKGR